jgi:hypothetical protein
MPTPRIKRSGADAVHHPSTQRQHECKREKITARDPLNRRKGTLQRYSEARKGDIDNGGIQLSEKGTEHSNGTDLPNRWIEPVGVTMCIIFI